MQTHVPGYRLWADLVESDDPYLSHFDLDTMTPNQGLSFVDSVLCQLCLKTRAMTLNLRHISQTMCRLG